METIEIAGFEGVDASKLLDEESDIEYDEGEGGCGGGDDAPDFTSAPDAAK
jgi:hypothetical protein